ncbi:ABC transporter ATP-binding protein [Rhodobacteraceae bacterium F11138]|nr:ABC transporter ATP-binding protein [Rhodobacteraceae bacterium F11138]
MSGDNTTVIEGRNLKTHFEGRNGLISAMLGGKSETVHALDGVDLHIDKKEIVGIVGESGCGKSTLGMTLARMYEPTSGQILFGQQDITNLHGSKLKSYRGSAQIIFQDPYSSLNPRLTVEQIIREPLNIHRIGNETEKAARVAEVLNRVQMPPETYLHRFPSNLSGGQRQRVAIARALVLRPELIVADEPVSMLDVSIQAGILELLNQLSKELDLAVLYISHDIATVGYICDRVAVMYLGRIVEQGSSDDVMHSPLHPYSDRLMAAVPSIDATASRERVHLSGEVPSPTNIPAGCRFAARCPAATALCHTVEPELYEARPDHKVRCHLYLPEDRDLRPDLERPKAHPFA